MHQLELQKNQKIYIASDFHLGYPSGEEHDSKAREQKVIRWLDEAQKDAALIILLGDIFDFWYEYKRVVPKGFVRLQGKIAELTDQGLPVVFFTGNHDLWMFGYFEKELGVNVYHQPQEVVWNQKKIILGHGDGLGNGDHAYKFMKRALFQNPICRFLFEWLHPNIGIGLAYLWSNSRKPQDPKKFIAQSYKGKESEWIWQHCHALHQQNPQDYYIFGHRHLPLCIQMATAQTADKTTTLDSRSSYYLNTGEWINQFTYLVFEANQEGDFVFNQNVFEANTAWIVEKID